MLLLLAGVIGLLFAIPVGSIGSPYLIAFSVAAIAGIALVVPRGLFVTVAQLPLVFTILTPLVAWFTASFADPSVGGALESTPRRTRVITAAYPIIQYFPWIAVVTLIVLAIAVWRYLEVTRRNAKVEKISRKEKRKLQRADETTTRSATKARRRVAESDARRSRHGADSTGSRPAADIIRDAEERRKRLAERSRRRQVGADAATAAGATAAPAGATAGGRAGAGSQPLRPRPGARPEGPRQEERPTRPTADERRRAAAAEQSRRSAYRPDRLSTRRAADDRREPPRGVFPREDDAVRGAQPVRREQPIRREPAPGRRPADTGRPEPQRRVQEWPPRHERPRHSPRDPEDRGRDPRAVRSLDPRDPRAPRDARDPRDPRVQRDPRARRDPRDPRISHDPRDDRDYRNPGNAGPRRRVEDLDFGNRRDERGRRRDDRRGYDDRRDPRRR